MKIVFLDTETTGLSPQKGDRIIELACIEYKDKKPTGRRLHTYLNPQGKKSNIHAFKVHGISDQSLKDKPLFRSIAPEFIDLIRGADLVAHNSKFDVNFLNAELERIGRKDIKYYANSVIDWA